MFYIVSKLFSFLILPVGWIILLLAYAAFCKSRKRARIFNGLAIALFWLMASPFFINFFMKKWELAEKDIYKMPHYTYGILLTGGLIHEGTEYPENINLDQSADRLWQTLRLYKLGKIDSIVISGGDVTILYDKALFEGQFARRFLLENGVPESRVYHEDKSKNTHENAAFTAEYLRSKKVKEKVLLITSAYHMRRARACFEKQGVVTEGFGSNYLSYQSKSDIIDYLPASESLLNAQILCKEVWGFLIYSMVGYI